MKTTFFALCTVALASFASAAPAPVADAEPEPIVSWLKDGHKASKSNKKASPAVFTFDKVIKCNATPDQVVSASNQPTGGLPGASGTYLFGLNAALDTICYNITLNNVRGDYQSPARTATHIHEAARGLNGPPRIAFPNPVGDDVKRTGYGCVTGPFLTGVMANGADTGAGFTVQKILDNPAGFFCDTHTTTAVPGAVRGQLGNDC